jgi:hypothetical protein
MTCHMHPGNNMVATYLGLLWWDNETDARAAGMYPAKQRDSLRGGGVPKARPQPRRLFGARQLV